MLAYRHQLLHHDRIFEIWYCCLKLQITKKIWKRFKNLQCLMYLGNSESAILCVLHTHVPACLACLHAYVPMCFGYLRAHVLTCLEYLPAHVPTSLACLRAHGATCFACFRANAPTSSRAITSNNKNKVSMTSFT